MRDIKMAALLIHTKESVILFCLIHVINFTFVTGIEPTVAPQMEITQATYTEDYASSQEPNNISVPPNCTEKACNSSWLNLAGRDDFTGRSSVITNTQTVDYVGYVVVPFLLFISILGNVVTMIIMNKRPFNKLPGGVLLSSLALCDLSVAFMLPLNRVFVREMFGTDLRALSKAGCNCFFWYFRTMKMTSSWIVVLISAERFVAVWFGIHAKMINTRRNAMLGVLICFSFFGVYNGPWSSVADVIIDGVCIPNTKPPGLAGTVEVLLIVGLSIYCFIPAAVMILLNSLILYKLSALKHQPSGQKNWAKKEGSSRPTAILIGVVAAFIILVMPISVAHLVFFAKKQSIFTAQGYSMTVFREVSQNMEQLNYSLNFILYIICSKGYRKRFLEMFAKKNVVHPGMDMSDTQNSNSRTMQTFASGSSRSLNKNNLLSPHPNPQHLHDTSAKF